MPSLNCSVMAISTCVALRAGPSTRTRSMRPLGPTRVTFSWQANWPGCDRSLCGVKLVARAEQRLDVFLGQVHVVRRDLDGNRLLLLRFEDCVR